MSGFDNLDRGDCAPRRASGGRSYVYVLPCRHDTLLKIGFTRDPLRRLKSLHARYFEFFDLGGGALVETDHVRDARRIERHLLGMFASDSAPAPLTVPRAAAGYTEWYRGIHDEALAAAGAESLGGGHALHAPLASWLATRFGERSDLIFDWSSKALEMVQFERFNPGTSEKRGGWDGALRNALDAYQAIGLPLASLVPEAVARWYFDVEAPP